MKPANYLTLLALLGSLTTASAESSRLPYSEKVPMNLANKAIPGTAIKSSKGIGNPENLLTSSSSDTSTLPSGKSEAVIKLVGQHLITDIQFINDGAEGKVAAFSSVDEKNWTPVGQVPFNSSMRLIPMRFAGVGARYIKIDFELTKGSTIRSFQLFGATTDKDYKFTVGGNSEAGSGSPRPIYAFPTPVNVNEVDFKRNNFKFPKTKDRYRTIIYDLGNVRTIKEFSTAYSSKPTRLEVFTFEQLPEKKDWRGKLTFDPTSLDKIKPVASGVDSRGEGHLLVKPEKPIKAQYVAMRYEPNYNRHGSQASLEAESSMVEFVAAAFEPYTTIAKEFGMGGHFIVAGDTSEDDEFLVASNDFNMPDVTFTPTFNPNSGPTSGQGGGTNGNQNGNTQNGNNENGNNENGGSPGSSSLDQASTAAMNAMNSYFSNPSFSGGGGGAGGGGIGNPFQVPTGNGPGTQPPANPPTTPTIIITPATPPPVPPASS
jgi:hypothetical protein